MTNPAAIKALAAGQIDNFVAASMPGGIEMQEAAGARHLQESELLPRQIGGHDHGQAHFEALGFVFGETVDEVFRQGSLPPGWSKRSVSSYWTDILDEQGRKRGEMFYKAAFYDRRANIRLNPRFYIDSYTGCDSAGIATADGERSTHSSVRLIDSGNASRLFGVYANGDYDTCKIMEREAQDWLKANYPDWNNPLAYWDSSLNGSGER